MGPFLIFGIFTVILSASVECGAPKIECVLNVDCADGLACIRSHCVDPCPGTCGLGAQCIVRKHIPECSCPSGMEGNPFIKCRIKESASQVDHIDPCTSINPCAANTICKAQNGVASCQCLPDYFGNPLESCRPECTLNTDCAPNRACVRNKCVNPCIDTCTSNADCQVENHLPKCVCRAGYTGDSYRYCSLVPEKSGKSEPDCVVSSECPDDEACVNKKCVNPCTSSDVCGQKANCRMNNHSPICTCEHGYTGDPFTVCISMQHTSNFDPKNPCSSERYPCGPFSLCDVIGDVPSCSCLPGYHGSPPNCRPECALNSDCPNNKACNKSQCDDPCPGVCASNADCQVVNHLPTCVCRAGYTGDPYRYCSLIPGKSDPCEPNPCAANGICMGQNGVASCQCLPDYFGNPYESCRPECTLNSDCPSNRACVRNKCVDPCPGVCASNADCQVLNHLPICVCRAGYTGDSYRYCSLIPGKSGKDCVVSSECPDDEACVDKKCVNPCTSSDVCGQNAICEMVGHNPICSCGPGYTGDPFTVCRPHKSTQQTSNFDPKNPCSSDKYPCGPFSHCAVINDYPICSCLPEYIGSPPNCHPECVLNSDCPSNQACIRNRCLDPCPGSCGVQAQCNVVSHIPVCTCPDGYTGNAFTNCYPVGPQNGMPQDKCNPSPCAANAQCNDGFCTCLPGLQGDPYTLCRPECVLNTDCARDRVCLRGKCSNPCDSSTCAPDALCTVKEHIPICICPSGTGGDAFIKCGSVRNETVQLAEEKFLGCGSSPCGAFSQCREIKNQALCACLPGNVGNPPRCHPMCTGKFDCPSYQPNDEPINLKPCKSNLCGVNAECFIMKSQVLSCRCSAGYAGDPFQICISIEQK